MIELLLKHDGRNWIAENEFLAVRGETLPELDNKLRDLLTGENSNTENEQIKVRMLFDNSTIPAWIRPYAGHYMNRIIEINLESVQ